MVNQKTILTVALVLLILLPVSKARMEVKETDIFGNQINKSLRCVLKVGNVFYERIQKEVGDGPGELIDKKKAKEYLKSLNEREIKEIIEEIKNTSPLLKICKSEKLIKEWD